MVVYPSSQYGGLHCLMSSSASSREQIKRLMANAELWGKVSMLRSCIAMQRDFNKAEGWTERKHIRFSKDKCQVLPQGQKCSLWQYKLGTTVQEGPGKGCRMQCCLHRGHSQKHKGNMAPTQLL